MSADAVDGSTERVPSQWTTCTIEGLPPNLVPNFMKIALDTRTTINFTTGRMNLTPELEPRHPEWDRKLEDVIRDFRRSAPLMRVTFA
ncbi:MAG: hypothetical protein V1908_03790 [Candidatus Peregrinibacteria bacterium]